MNIKEHIRQLAEREDRFTTADVLGILHNKVTRQAVHLALRELIDRGELAKGGATRGSFYARPDRAATFLTHVHKRLKNESLEEHRVFTVIKEQAPFIDRLPDNIFSIVQFAFDEMLNNAIEHSESDTIDINVVKEKTAISFVIQDAGIGVFQNIMRKRGLASELEAIQDLLKGKTTTAPKAHSGEGIFFTSKAVDRFVLESFGMRLIVDNVIGDVFVEEVQTRKKRGTMVTCHITLTSDRHLNDVFRKYQTDPEEYGFDKTEVQVRLYTMGTVYVSRSQARRVLAGLEKFKTITLDFDRVPTVGQAFADEIFRVFKNRHPDITIIPVHMNSAVEFMVERVAKE
jgi:anti-sigma regulatory factor (Ser/Thr protein kinase)